MKRHGGFFPVVLFALITVIATVSCVKIKDTVNVRLVDISTAPAPGLQGTTDCAYDKDCDGLSDSLENSGITLTGTGAPIYQKCDGVIERENCVDPDSRDLFVILERASSNSLIPTTSSFKPFEFISKSRAQGGLEIIVHEVSISDGDISSNRQVTSGSDQKAIRVDENNTLSDFNSDCTGDPVGVKLGGTSTPGQGLPNDGLYATINTKNIVGYIDNYCAGKTTCSDYVSSITGTPDECDYDGGVVELGELDSLDNQLIKYILAHEVAHNLKLTWNHSNKNGWHHKPEIVKIMEKSLKISEGASETVFYISDDFDEECQDAARIVLSDDE